MEPIKIPETAMAVAVVLAKEAKIAASEAQKAQALLNNYLAIQVPTLVGLDPKVAQSEYKIDFKHGRLLPLSDEEKAILATEKAQHA